MVVFISRLINSTKIIQVYVDYIFHERWHVETALYLDISHRLFHEHAARLFPDADR